jgi:formylglycine-generating enzyme required for sulfatase activity/predicted esterase
MIVNGGLVKVVDFGLAKLVGGPDLTRTRSTVGTVAYMSPEQARGEAVDHRTDVWSLGVVLYEMLTGRLPFPGEYEAAIIYSILNESPKPLRDLRGDIPAELERIVLRALEKDPESRYASVAEVLKDLTDYQASLRATEVQEVGLKGLLRQVRRPRFAIPGAVLILALSFLAVRFFERSAKARWAREQAMPEIARLVEKEDFTAAFQMALEAEKYIPTDPQLTKLWPVMSAYVSVRTAPQGADVYVKDYRAVEGEWQHLGRSPIDSVRISRGFKRWKIAKEGFVTLEYARGAALTAADTLRLSEKGSIPPEMVRAPGGSVSYLTMPSIPRSESIQLSNFLIDRYEVTNRQFKGFLDRGGYQNRVYWKHKFVRDGRVLTWEEAVAEFRDATGRPGPATWELGDYPRGQDDYPVTGVSWYEAAAYAEFAGKCLPTVYHWNRAAGIGDASYIIPLSNFGDKGPARVGSHQGMGPFGTYDMAGNVREWCWNESGYLRYILGGAWGDPSYLFTGPAEALSPFDRSPANGFRCVRYLDAGGTPEMVFRPVERLFRDYNREKPVSEDIFQVYKNQFSYDRTDLNPVIEWTDEKSEQWTQEKVTFNAAYGNERVIAYLFLPKAGTSPYQTVILFPGLGTLRRTSSDSLAKKLLLDQFGVSEFIVKSGRALMYPIYKGTYERNDGVSIPGAHRFAENLIKRVKDFRRSVDYLESRKDIDSNRLAYYGISWGALMGAIIPAVEPRLKTSVLSAGGLFSMRNVLPEVDPFNFVSRVRIPTLMLNGRYDAIFPLETSQLPMFRLLGVPEADKRHVIYETGHSVPRNELIKETLNWLDRYLGPVRR